MDVARWHGVSASAAGNSYATIRDVLAYDNALREGRLVNAAHTAQMLHSAQSAGRSSARFGYAGGAPGVNTVVMGNGEWTLVVLTNNAAAHCRSHRNRVSAVGGTSAAITWRL